ncbi:MAG: hypothetical protein ABI367_02925 [Mucilaginibacter sp.]
MENNNNQPSRRKFMWGVGVLSLLVAAGSALKFPFLNKKAAVKGKTVKMLTQDGKLVEVDAALITSARKKATNSDLQNWINK